MCPIRVSRASGDDAQSVYGAESCLPATQFRDKIRFTARSPPQSSQSEDFRERANNDHVRVLSHQLNHAEATAIVDQFKISPVHEHHALARLRFRTAATTPSTTAPVGCLL